MIKKTENGKYQADITVGGRSGKRIRKIFSSRHEAKRFEADSIMQWRQNLSWNKTNTRDNRRLIELCDIWFNFYGKVLKDGKNRLKVLKNVIDCLKNPKIDDFTKKDFLNYRNKRTDITANTINHHHAYLNSMFNELVRLDEISHNPIDKIKRLKLQEKELTYLTQKKIQNLLDALKKRDSHAYIISRICLSTGARWGEAVSVRAENIKGGILTIGSKNDKLRKIPIAEDIAKEIIKNAPFKDGYNTFKKVIKAFELPKGQSTHILRHTFASHFMMNGGDILTLQKILGHSDLKMTMRYTHFSSAHMASVLKLNPLSSFCRHNSQK